VRTLRLKRSLGALAAVGLLAACTGGSGETTVPTTETTAATVDTTAAPTTVPVVATTAPIPVAAPPTTRTLNVPADFATIQAAVDAAKPGDLVLIAAGTYAEGVAVRTPSIVVRGVDRNTVILDGGDTIENGILVAADNVAVENLTVRRFAVNGLLFTKAYDDDAADPTKHKILQGYRASYITAANNGLYGIYAFFARGGVIEHSYASGHSDSGFYVGQCKPCDAVLRDNVAELNAVGYEGTNASGNLWVVSSIWRRNRVGVTPNSQDMERLAPQGDTVVAGNLIEDNQDPGSPSAAQGGTGLGVAVGGGERNVIVRNRIRRNVNVGVFVTDLAGYQPSANEVRENVLEDNGTDLVLASSDGAASVPSRTNCFAGNTFTSSLPTGIEKAAGCAGATGPGVADVPVSAGPVSLKPGAPNVDYRTVPLPPAQPVMPDAAMPKREPASAASPVLDIASIALPKP
jgi:Right handed beta helix region